MQFSGYFNDTAQDIIGIMNQAQEVMIRGEQMGVPGYTTSPGSAIATTYALPSTGIAPALPPVHAQAAAVVPIMPVLLGGAAGYFYKRSLLWGAIGAAAGFILGSMFGSVAVASSVTAVPIAPPQLV